MHESSTVLEVSVNNRLEPEIEELNSNPFGHKESIKSGRKLILSLSDCFQVVDLQELLFCESDKGYTSFYLVNGKKYIVSKPLITYEETLARFNFTRPHQSYMVNLEFIDRYDKSGIIHLRSGHKIPVSLRKKEAFISTFLSYHRL